MVAELGRARGRGEHGNAEGLKSRPCGSDRNTGLAVLSREFRDGLDGLSYLCLRLSVGRNTRTDLVAAPKPRIGRVPARMADDAHDKADTKTQQEARYFPLTRITRHKNLLKDPPSV